MDDVFFYGVLVSQCPLHYIGRSHYCNREKYIIEWANRTLSLCSYGSALLKILYPNGDVKSTHIIYKKNSQLSLF